MLKIFRKFFSFCGNINKKKFYKSLFLGVVFALMEAMKIPAIMLLIDGAIKKNVTPELILECFGILLASVIIGSAVKYHITMLQCEAGYYTAANKRIEIAKHMRYLPMGYFNKNSLGQITSVTTNTMESLADVCTRVVMMTTQGLLTTFVITAMILIFDIRIGLVAVAGILLFLVVNSILQKKSQVLAPVKAKSDEDVVEKVLEYIQGISEVKGYNLVGRTSKKLNGAIEENRRINTDMEIKFVPVMQIQNIIIKLTGVVMSILSVYFYLYRSMLLLNCIGMIICSFIVLDSLGTAGNYSALLRTVDVGIDKVQAVLDIPEMDIEGKEIIPESYDIDVNNISFCYDKDMAQKKSKIIDNVSVHIPEKTTTAIAGPSGGGKTTLCHLISRFWDVDSGSITLGGEDVRNYSMDSLMKNFSFVFQDVYLFEDTIANNIRFGQSDAPMEKIVEAAKKACCHDFITALPNGYDTVIGEGGANLSGGEKQRISIARAIMKDSPIIILDEATANVDPENEKELMTAIDELTREKTILMIAHRLKTVRNADKILVLDHGKIVQQGNHRELMNQEGIYKRFVESRELAASWKL
ncbi:MAG: ABC transporter ATP-binding protein [Porcipelethomonas sp.]